MVLPRSHSQQCAPPPPLLHRRCAAPPENARTGSSPREPVAGTPPPFLEQAGTRLAAEAQLRSRAARDGARVLLPPWVAPGRALRVCWRGGFSHLAGCTINGSESMQNDRHTFSVTYF